MNAVPLDRRMDRDWRVRITQHRRAAADALGRLRAQPAGALLTILVLAVALLLPLLLASGLHNLRRLAGDLADSGQIHLYLDADTPMPQAEALAAQLRERPDVVSVSIRTPEQGLAEFREHSGLAPALDLLEDNPLPPVLRVRPRGEPSVLVPRLLELPGIAGIEHDAEWRDRLQAWLGFGRQLALGVAALLLAVAALVVGNTVRLDLAGRAMEIAILQQLGADDDYLTRPLRYLGALLGALAGLLALALLVLAGVVLSQPLATLAASYGSTWALQPPPATWWGLAVAAGTLAGWLGASAVAGHHVRSTRPVDP